jgi:hypothetical protein
MDLLSKILNKIYNKVYPGVRNIKTKSNYFGNPVLSKEEGNQLIGNLIKADKPFVVGRIGSTEMFTLTNYIEK